MSFIATTHNITVTATPVYLALQSDFFAHRFAFAYFIEILNDGDESVQLVRRRWRIVDGNGKTNIVEGEGVIGKQPHIKPGENYEYNSFCILETFTGYMKGKYVMRKENGEEFEIIIPKFILSANSN